MNLNNIPTAADDLINMKFPLSSPEDEEEREREYRRGYRDGMIQAYNYFPMRASKKTDSIFCWLMGELLDWCLGDCSHVIHAPLDKLMRIVKH